MRKRKDEYTDRELFFRLYYRERIGRLVERLYRQAMCPMNSDLSISSVEVRLKEIVARAEDDTRCNHLCKDMYFCELKKGHKGPHKESGLAWED